jgi:predicted permease
LTIINLALPFFGLIFVGFFSGKLMSIEKTGLAWLNFFIVYIALPPMLFRLIAKAPFENLVNWPYILGTTLSTYMVFLVVFITAIVIGRSGISKSAMQASVASYGNVGYMGIPLMLAVFGEKAAIPATLILCFDSLLQFIIVPLLQGVGGHVKGGWASTLKRIFTNVLLNPFILATELGFIASWYQYTPPPAIDNMLRYMGNAAPACALFALGVTVALQPLKRIGWDLPFITATKLILHPLIVLGVLLVMGGFSSTWIQVAVLMAALPTAANVFVMATHYDTYVDGTSSAILFNTLISLGTISVLLFLLTTDRLPMSLTFFSN